jgi:hypothetical protein
MYSEAMARAALADRARERDSALHAHRMLDRTRRPRRADGFLARVIGRRWWSDPREGMTIPAPIVALETGKNRSTPSSELRAS